MKKNSAGFLLVFCFANLLSTSPVLATDFRPAVVVDGQSISRVGVATARYAGMLKIYDAALYAPERIESGKLLDPAIPKKLEIAYRVAIKAHQLVEAANTVLERQNSSVQLARWQPAIDNLHRNYRNVEKGDRFALVADNRGLSLNLNGETLTTIEDAEFSRVYLSIWLGDKPLSEGLKKDLMP